MVREPGWWLQALGGIPRCLGARRPVPWADYRRWLQLADVGSSQVDAGTRVETAAVRTAV